MYQPDHFRVEDTAILHAFIRAHPLGLLISVDDDGRPVADPLPLLLDDGGGVLRAHMALANPHWRLLEQAKTALVVFQAAGHYISPSWYPTKLETGKVVPTWNYVCVQVRGAVTVHHEADWLARQVSDLTRTHEAGRAQPWAVSDAPPDFIAAQLRGIVGFEIAISEIAGKFKLSQNRTTRDQLAVVDKLEMAEGGDETAVLMRGLGIGGERKT